MHYLIYKVTNTLNQKFYIGAHATTEPNDRYFGSGVRLRNAIKKYGKHSFAKEILYSFNTSEEMFAKEAELVTEDFIARDDVYNMHVGGHGAPRGNTYGKKSWRTGNEPFAFKEGNRAAAGNQHTAESRRAIGVAKLGNQHARGKIRSAETRRKISIARQGKKFPRNPIELPQPSNTEG